MKKKKEIEFEVSSGNVFADLGLPNPEELLLKSELARQITNLIDNNKKLSETKAAKLLDISKSELDLLTRGRLDNFSFEVLFRFLNILGQNITIDIKPKKISSKQPTTEIVKQRKQKIFPNLIRQDSTISQNHIRAKKK